LGREGGDGGQEVKMTRIIYAHVNKWIRKKEFNLMH
jgi:hypothetical protein